MTKLREEIPYSAFQAARAACELMKASDVRRQDLADLDCEFPFPPRETRYDRDDDVVVMTIN
ncbi:hypothetical protein [Aquibium oceanicum]|nr:hypothetical protein [Aquibium oceanicum]